MRGKLCITGILLSLVLVISFSGQAMAQALSCDVKLSCNVGETEILRLSDEYNAHAEMAGYSGAGGFPSPYRICCSTGAPVTIGTNCGAGVSETMLWLSDPTNAHVATDPKLPAYATYNDQACISGINVVCGYGPNCNAFGPNPGDAECLASISGDGNAHIGACENGGGGMAYATKICCWADVGEPYKYLAIIDRYGRTNPNWLNMSEYYAGATNAVNFTVVMEASDYSGVQSMLLQYAVFDQSGGTVVPWQTWKTTPNNSTFPFGVLVPGPAFDPFDINSYDGRVIAFRMNATDTGGITNRYSETGPWLNLTLDITPPNCSMDQPGVLNGGTYWSRAVFNITWHGQDLTSYGSPEGSGIDEYRVEYRRNGGAWRDVFDPVFGINNTPQYQCVAGSCALLVAGIVDNDLLEFRISAIDVAGNLGPTTPVVSTRIDLSSPLSAITTPATLWVNSSDPFGPPLLKINWESDDSLSKLDCAYLKFRRCLIDAGPTTGTVCTGGWTSWFYVIDNFTADTTECYAEDSCVGDTCYYEAFFGGTGEDASGTPYYEDIHSGQIYDFSVWSTDNAGNVEPHAAADPVVDIDKPLFVYDVVDNMGNSIKDSGLITAAMSYVNITTTAWDDHSGVFQHQLEFCRNTDPCIIDTAGPGAPWGGTTDIIRKIDVGMDTVVRFRMLVQDNAGNWNSSVWYYISSHQLSNFLLHELYLSLGQHYDMRVQVRNMDTAYDNVTINLTGYGMAYFLDTTDGVISPDKRGIKVGLYPHESKEIMVRILTSTVRAEPYQLNMTAESAISATTDADTVLITVGYPAAFPGLSAYSLALVVIVSVLIAYAASGKSGMWGRSRVN